MPAGNDLPFPIIADAKREMVVSLGMLDPAEKDAAGVPLPARTLFIIGPDKKVKLSILYPATTGRDFNEVLRVLKSLRYTADLKLATPANWKEGDKMICSPGLSNDDAKKYSGFQIVDVASK